jgi:hypothetical protein
MAILTTYSQFRATFATSATIGLDGFAVWPNASLAAVTTLTVPATATFPFLIQVDASNDPTAGVDRYDWYVSQRTDVTTRQYLSVARNDAAPFTNSGKISIGLTALATSLLYATPLSTKQITELFTNVDVYVQNKATNAIQHVLVLERLTADV